MRSELTTQERDEIEALSFTLLGRTSAWQKSVKKGVAKPLLDAEGKQVLHKGIKVSRLVYKTENEVLTDLRNLNTLFLAEKKRKAEEAEKKRLEEVAKKQLAEASGSTGE